MEIAKIVSRQPVIDATGGSGVPTLRDATQQFESLFITQLMKSMRGTVPESHLMGSGRGQQLFREMLDQELANRVAQSGGVGIGEMLYQQLSMNHSRPVKNGTQEEQSGLAASGENDSRTRPATIMSRSQNHED